MFYLDLNHNIILDYEPPYEGARIGTIPQVYNKEKLGVYMKIVKTQLLDIHFTVSADESHNLSFLVFIRDNMHKYGKVEVVGNIKELYGDSLLSAVYITNNGYQQFRCSGLELLLKMYKDFKDEINN